MACRNHTNAGRSTGSVAMLAIGFGCSFALAQTQSNDQRQEGQNPAAQSQPSSTTNQSGVPSKGGVQSGAPNPAKGSLGGVPAEAPRPMTGLGGVPAAFPDVLRGGLGGVPAALPEPFSGGSLLEKRLKPPPATPPPPPISGPTVFPIRGVYWYDRGWWSNAPVGQRYAGTDPFIRDGLAPRPAPPLVDTRSDLERANDAYANESFDEAARLYRQYLSENPEDAVVRRLFGLVLLDRMKVREGVDAIFAAYKAQPRLATDPISTDDVPGGATAMRKRFSNALAQAQRANSAEAYFVAAVLAQGEGRDEVARRVLDKAKLEGLPGDLNEALRQALTPAKAPRSKSEEAVPAGVAH